MRLRDLLYKVNTLEVVGPINIDITNVYFDSRKVRANGLFIAIRGTVSDGHNYIQMAIDKGVLAVVVEKLPFNINPSITYIKVPRSDEALGFISSNFYKNPSERIKLVGVTGTNGKTTVVSLLHQLFMKLDAKSGMLSTIENRIGDKIIPSTHTTGDSLQINYLLNEMIKNGCSYCFMEVSSHALHQKRVSGLHFSAGIFTNLTQDHLDYHKTFAEYRDVKKSFFDSLNQSAFALVNKDDKNSHKMIEGTKARKCTYALKSLAHYKCKILENQFNGMLLQINQIDVWVKLFGYFNAYNILSVYAVAKEFGFKKHNILTYLSMLNSAEGRVQFVSNQDSIIGIVDYAHTHDALTKVIESINNIRTQKQKLITIVGCGGDRDKFKRPLMAKVVCDLSSQVIITSDNPRSEDPKHIIQDMLEGLDTIQQQKVLVITDRREAIMTAGRLAQQSDIILIAGKGHEKYQEIKGERIPFDDMKELKKSLKILK